MLKSIMEYMLELSSPMPASQTIAGKLVSISYYAQNKSKPGGGLDQKLSDARASINWEGMPAGIVTSSGKAYQLVGGVTSNNNAKIIDLIGKTVTVIGDVSEMHGMTVISADNASSVR